MKRITSIIIVSILGFLVFMSLDAKELKDHNEVAEHYIKRGLEETGAINIVTSIYLGYRAYDTFGEIVILFITGTGISLILKRK